MQTFGVVVDWSALPDFLMIARCRSLTGAAQRLGVNHSTVYRRLNALEAQLQCRLFDRLASGYRLTPEGRVLLAQAEAMEAAALQAERALTGTDVSPRGDVRLTAPENLAYTYLPGYLVELRERYPDIRVTLVVTNTDLDLTRREADLALRATPRPPEHLVGRKLTDIAWAVFAAPALLSRHPRPPDLDAALGLPWVGPEAALMHLAAFRWLGARLAEHRVVARGSTLNAMAAFASVGLGLVALPLDQQRPELQPILPLPPGSGSALWLLTHPDLRRVARVQVVMGFLAEAFRGDPRWPFSAAHADLG